MVEYFKPNRRRFLYFSTTAVSSIFWTMSVSPPALALSTYKPVYFTPAEWAFLQSAADRLIPSDEEGPGALDLDVPLFIDKQMMEPYGSGALWYTQGPFDPAAPATLGYQGGLTPRDIYRLGIAALEDWCQKNHGKNFSDLDHQTQDNILKLMEKDQIPLTNPTASTLFGQILTNVKEGYFADPLYGGNRNMGGWLMIGFPGARADFTDWMSKPGAYYPLSPVSINLRSGEPSQ